MSEVGGLAYRFSGVQSEREKRVCIISVNQWATNEEKQDEEKCGPSQKLSEQGEQRCCEPSVVCLGNIEDSQKEESCNNQDVKEQRQRQEPLLHLWTEDDGWN